MPRADIRFQPAAGRGLLRGVDTIANAVRPTIGPQPGVVAIAAAGPSLRPELLDDGAMIARRVIQLADSDADVGAMLMRQMLWQLHEDVGDGSATAALIFRSLLADGLRYISAGGDAMALRTHLEAGLCQLQAQLTSLTRPLEDVVSAARRLCDDAALAAGLGDIFAALGPYVAVEILEGQGRDIERETIAGTFWGLSGLLASTGASAAQMDLEHPLILATDLDLETPQDLQAPLRCTLRSGARSLVIVARSVSDNAAGFITSAKASGQFQLLCVKTPGQDTIRQMQALQDLALLTGCRPLLRAAGQTLESVREADLGRASRAWATRDNFGIGPGPDADQAIDVYVESLQQQIDASADPSVRAGLYERLSRFLGASAILRVGGTTLSEMKTRKVQAERALRTLRSASIEGVVPGGGMALMVCGARLAASAQDRGDDAAQASRRMLAHALQQPFRAIVENSGIEPGVALAEVMAEGCLDGQYAYDALNRRVVDAELAGLLDPAQVVSAAVRAAVKTAALCLTLDVIVHHKQPEMALNP